MLEIKINGVVYRLNQGVTLTQLLTFLKCKLAGIAVEYNYKIVKQEFWSKILLKTGDNLEIVTVVGGG
jgi:sulfur carrier protein